MKFCRAEEVQCRTSLWDYYSISKSPTRLDEKHETNMGIGFQTNETSQSNSTETITGLKSNVRIEQYCVLPSRRASEMKL